jgi:hypothetical protein
MKYLVSGALAACLASGLAVGCNADPSSDDGQGIDQPPPCPECAAASGTVGQGAILPDFSFQGFVDDGNVQHKSLSTIALWDFYNPHAGDPTYQPADPKDDDRLFPPGSQYNPDPLTQTSKPTALLLDIASVWCGPCNEEARNTLNGLYAKYKPCGGEFVFQLAEGSAPGVAVTETTLEAWVSMYHVTYPATFDPAKQLFPLYSADSFPDSAIVDTRTMLVVDVISGVPDTTFWSKYESLLDPTCLAGK